MSIETKTTHETGNTYHLEYKSQRKRLLLGDFGKNRKSGVSD